MDNAGPRFREQVETWGAVYEQAQRCALCCTGRAAQELSVPCAAVHFTAKYCGCTSSECSCDGGLCGMRSPCRRWAAMHSRCSEAHKVAAVVW